MSSERWWKIYFHRHDFVPRLTGWYVSKAPFHRDFSTPHATAASAMDWLKKHLHVRGRAP